MTLWTTWQLSTAAGIFLGAQVPASWGLDFTLALTFIALTVPAIDDRPALLAALSAGATAILARGLPYKLGLMAAASRWASWWAYGARRNERRSGSS